MRRTIVIIVVVVLLGAAGAFFVRQQQAAADTVIEILREAEVERGRITATVNATGSIEPESLVTLTFGSGGMVQEVAVVRGQQVTPGDILATLDTAELQLAVQQAEDALRIQQLTLQQLLNSEPTPATLASAQADIDAAEANLAVAEANLAAAEASVLQAQAQKTQLLAGPSDSQIGAAEANVASAELQQQNAQETYNQTLQCFDVDIPGSDTEEVCPGLGEPERQARASLQSANAALESAQAQLNDLLAGPGAGDIQGADAAIASAQANVLASEGNVAAAEANLARAQAAYNRLLEGPSEDDIAIAEAQVASAETNLELAQLRLDLARLTAPMAGRIANVLINEGEQASPGAPAITIVNEEAFHINVNVDEIDIDQIAVGQPVDITLDALPDMTVEGVIGEIAPTPTNSGGVVSYLVTINIEPAEGVELRPGMSTNASIVVEEIDEVLVVPNWAIRLDRETGEALVNVLQPDGTIEEVVVETGLRNELFSEVVSGLSAGDTVVVSNEREAFNFFGGGEE